MNKHELMIRPDDMNSASIMINYTGRTGSINDVISIPVDGLTTKDLVTISEQAKNGNNKSMYTTLFASNAKFYAPISMSTMLTMNYDYINWNDEDTKLETIMNDSRITRVSLNVSYGTNNVYTVDFPMPTETELNRLYGL